MLGHNPRPFQFDKRLTESGAEKAGRFAQPQGPLRHIALVREHGRMQRWDIRQAVRSGRDGFVRDELLVLASLQHLKPHRCSRTEQDFFAIDYLALHHADSFSKIKFLTSILLWKMESSM
jgi:hypothetical protein